MPVELFGSIRVVEEIDGDGLAFFEAQERSGKLAVIGRDANDALGSDFDGRSFDVDRVVG